MSLKPNLATYPKKKPLPRNVIDCNHLHREKDLWHEKLVEKLEQLKQSPLIEEFRGNPEDIIDEFLGKTQ